MTWNPRRLETLRARLPVNRSRLFRAYPGPPDPGVLEAWDDSDWVVRERERIPAAYGRPVLRTLLQHRERGDRVCLDAWETRSQIEACETLAALLAHDQEAALPPGPEGLGRISVASGSDDVRTHYFILGNLVFVSSRLSGEEKSEVDAGLAAREEVLRTTPAAEGLRITASPPPDEGIELGSRAVLAVDGLQPDEHLKIFAENGELSTGEGELRLRAVQPHDVEITAVVADSGRALRAGHLTIKVLTR